MQLINKEWLPIAFVSRCLTAAERNYAGAGVYGRCVLRSQVPVLCVGPPFRAGHRSQCPVMAAET